MNVKMPDALSASTICGSCGAVFDQSVYHYALCRQNVGVVFVVALDFTFLNGVGENFADHEVAVFSVRCDDQILEAARLRQKRQDGRTDDAITR